MQLILTVLHLALALGLVGLILIQHGRGADAGAAFGSGASSTVFGAQGSGSFLTRSTAVLATLFFLTSMTLAYFAAQVGEPEGLMDGVEAPPPMVIDTGDIPLPDLPMDIGPAADIPSTDLSDLPTAGEGTNAVTAEPTATADGASEAPTEPPTSSSQSNDGDVPVAD
ncbi:MAG: preprotein translocase subunit SecG [Thiohalocapsa sp.]